MLSQFHAANYALSDAPRTRETVREEVANPAVWEIEKCGFGWQLLYQLLAEEDAPGEGLMFWALELFLHDRTGSGRINVAILELWDVSKLQTGQLVITLPYLETDSFKSIGPGDALSHCPWIIRRSIAGNTYGQMLMRE